MRRAWRKGTCVENFMNKAITLFLLFTSASFGQEFWNGARYGMSKAELETLFGSRLRVDRRLGLARDYMLATPEHFCGGYFEVGFIFFDEPGKGLAWVYLESQSGNPDGIIGQCVLRQITVQFGHPKATIPERGEYWFHHAFSRRWTVLWVQPKRVVIHYGRGRPSRYASFP